MKRIILAVLLLTSPLAHAEGYPGIFTCPLPPPGQTIDWCGPYMGQSTTVVQIVNGTHPYLIGFATGRQMVSTHLTVLLWSAMDSIMFTDDAITTILTSPSGQTAQSSTYAGRQRSPVFSSQIVSYLYWITNPFGNGTTVTMKSKHAPGRHIKELGGFFPGWFYPWKYSTGPITKL